MKEMVCVLTAVALGVMSALAGSMQHQADSLLDLLPPAGAINGWAHADSARVYEGEDLYALIDGGADLFLEYGFRRSLAAEYQNVADASITLEIYQMLDPGAAFGIYSIRSGENVDRVEIGQGGCERPYYIMFWKGPFYVSIAASDSTQRCRSGLESLAKAVDARIPVRGAEPYLVNLLPPDNLVKKRYVRGYLGLSSTSISRLEELFPAEDGVVGTYPDHVLVLMRYGSAALARHRAEGVFASFKSGERSTPSGSKNPVACFKRRDNQALCFAQEGKYLVISLSSEDSVADARCRGALLLLHSHI
jgi:hypothetical protein